MSSSRETRRSPATRTGVSAAYAKSVVTAVMPTSGQAKIEWSYADFGPPGPVVSRKRIDDLDITEVAFANGVRLNLKKTDFEANTIHIAARLGTGQLTEPAADEPGLSAFTGLTYTAGGLGRLSADDLKRVLAGRTVGLQFASTLDAFVLLGERTGRTLHSSSSCSPRRSPIRVTGPRPSASPASGSTWRTPPSSTRSGVRSRCRCPSSSRAATPASGCPRGTR